MPLTTQVDMIGDPRQAGAEIEVTPDMVDAGLDELRGHSLVGDARYMLESVYRAMAYARRSASVTSSVK